MFSVHAQKHVLFVECVDAVLNYTSLHYFVWSEILFNARYGVASKQRTLKNVTLQVCEMELD